MPAQRSQRPSPELKEKKPGLRAADFGGVGLAEELADGIEGAEENGGRGARGAGDGGLIDELDAGEVLGALEFLDGRGVAFGFLAELAGEVQIEDVVGEGGFAGAGDAGEAR